MRQYRPEDFEHEYIAQGAYHNLIDYAPWVVYASTQNSIGPIVNPICSVILGPE